MNDDNINIENLRNIIPDANEQIVERVRKLNELIESGVNPYPYSFGDITRANHITENFDSISEEDVFSVAGRIMLMRRMGKVVFITLQDQDGSIQIYLNRNALGEEAFDRIRLLDMGDIIGVQGTVFRTKTGEITIRAAEYTVLSKSVRPLPDKHHGLQDPDMRIRNRSLDMIMNNEVRERFIKRSRGITALRSFMNERAFIETDTPILDTKYGGGEAKPFETYVNAISSEVFLNVSPELYLKRLMVGGLERVYTLARSFRNEGIDRTHYPEFTLFECYMAYADYNDMMELMENLYEHVFTTVNGSTQVVYQGVEIDFKAPWRRARMCDLVMEATGIDVESLDREALISQIRAANLLNDKQLGTIDLDTISLGDLIMYLFDEFCAEALVQPTFVIDFPVETSPLCKTHRDAPQLIERFEPYAYGVELGNAYSELNDPIRQRTLLIEQADALRAGLETASPMDEEFARAIDVGMPPAGGLGIGIDRMMMFLTGASSIKDVIAFPMVKR